ncbi:MAG: GNAT family N-acetyltransferase [Hyphomicrobiales bacterium]|nr:GNAT family N-acetyltransferase [Hyphomicrobiales bacterium]
MREWDVTVAAGREARRAALAFAADAVFATPFQHPAWLAAWAKSFADDAAADLFLLEVRERGASDVVLRQPLARETRSGVRLLRGWDRGVADYGGPILARDFAADPAETVGLWAAIRAALPPCDLLVLDKMPARIGDLANPFLDLPGVERSANSTHVVRLDRVDGRSVVESFDGSMRRSLDRKRRKLRNKGDLAFRLVPACDAPEPLERLLEWRRARFAEENLGRDVAPVEAFWRRLACDASIARIAELSLDGRTLAAGFGTRVGDGFQLLATGFDVAWKNWSPGLLLTEDLVVAAEADGVRLFDFTIGDEAYKLDFHVEAEPLWDLFQPLTFKGRLAALWRRQQIRRRRHRLAVEAAAPAPAASA